MPSSPEPDPPKKVGRPRGGKRERRKRAGVEKHLNEGTLTPDQLVGSLAHYDVENTAGEVFTLPGERRAAAAALPAPSKAGAASSSAEGSAWGKVHAVRHWEVRDAEETGPPVFASTGALAKPKFFLVPAGDSLAQVRARAADPANRRRAEEQAAKALGIPCPKPSASSSPGIRVIPLAKGPPAPAVQKRPARSRSSSPVPRPSIAKPSQARVFRTSERNKIPVALLPTSKAPQPVLPADWAPSVPQPPPRRAPPPRKALPPSKAPSGVLPRPLSVPPALRRYLQRLSSRPARGRCARPACGRRARPAS